PERDGAGAEISSVRGHGVLLNSFATPSWRAGRRVGHYLCRCVSEKGFECNDLYPAIAEGCRLPRSVIRLVRMNARPRILVIEDDPEIRQLVQDYLQRQGFRVDVGDGGVALDRFRTTIGEPDLIVLDIMLPGQDGLSICRNLR